MPILAMTTTCSSQFPAIDSIILITSLTLFQPILCHFLCQAPRERVVGKKIRSSKLLILLPGVTAADVDGSLSAFCTGGEQLEPRKHCVVGQVAKVVGMRKLVVAGVATALICTGILMGISWWSASRPQVQAARLSLKLLQKQGREYDRLAERLHQLRLAAYERRFGHVAKR